MLRNFLIFVFAAFWLWSLWWAIQLTIFAIDHARTVAGSNGYRRAEFVVQDAGWRSFGARGSGPRGIGSAGVRVFQAEGMVNGNPEMLRVVQEEVTNLRLAPGDKTGDRFSMGAVLDVWYNPGMGDTINAATLRVAPYHPQFFETARKRLWGILITAYTPILVMLLFSFWWRQSQIERYGEHGTPRDLG